MDYRVIFKDTFLADLERIVRFIAAHNPSVARKLGDDGQGRWKGKKAKERLAEECSAEE